MAVERVKVSNANQIDVPADAREKLQIEPGDYLRVQVRSGSIVLIPEPKSHSRELRGLHGEIWRDIDPMEYLDDLRVPRDQ